MKVLLKYRNFPTPRKSDVDSSLLNECSVIMMEEREKGEEREGGENKTRVIPSRTA